MTRSYLVDVTEADKGYVSATVLTPNQYAIIMNPYSEETQQLLKGQSKLVKVRRIRTKLKVINGDQTFLHTNNIILCEYTSELQERELLVYDSIDITSFLHA